MEDGVYQVTTRYFCAGFVIENKKITAIKVDMTTYIIELGSVCFIDIAERAEDIIIKVMRVSALSKPGIHDINEWMIALKEKDLIVAHYKDIEVRVYKANNTIINLKPLCLTGQPVLEQKKYLCNEEL